MNEQMNEQLNNTKLGTLAQAYAAARWSHRPDAGDAARIGDSLDSALRDRIDALGLDAERLLAVTPDHVLHELQALEKEAILEDAGALRSASRARATETEWLRNKPDDTTSARRYPSRGGSRTAGHEHGRRRSGR